jgi:hypothetical protein
MAAILSVTYTPNYSGCHRICFRTSQASYCCYQDDTPTEIGEYKITDIDLDEYAECLVDIPFEIGCTDTIVNGYVQPCCIDATSVSNRVAFSVEYDSTPCTSFTIECQESGIAFITVTDSGSGYAVGEIPNVTITDSAGNGIGAVATANMRCPPFGFCDVLSITVNVEGQYYYYLNLINVVIDAPIGGGTTATADVTLLNDCGVFTVPDCNGAEVPTEYSLLGGPAYAINLCSGGGGFADIDYTLIQNPEPIPGNICFNLAIEAVDPYTCSISPAGTHNGKDYYIMVGPDCVTPYDRFIAPNVWTVWYSTGNGYVNQWVLSEGLNQYLYVAWYLPVSSSPDVPLGNWVLGPGPSAIDLVSTDTNCQVSCCNCVQYNVVVRNPIDIYYTDCNQTIISASVDAGAAGLTFCAVPNSVWPANKLDTGEILAITNLGNCP